MFACIHPTIRFAKSQVLGQKTTGTRLGPCARAAFVLKQDHLPTLEKDLNGGRI